MVANEDALKILKKRYVSGDISKKEYFEMKEELMDDEEETPAKEDRKSGSSGGGKIIAVIVLVVIILAGLYLLSTGALNSLLSGVVANSGGLVNPTVLVSGYVKTSFSTNPISVTFGSSTVPISNGYYSTSLQNDQQYAIIVSYSGLTGTKSCNAGTLDLQVSSSSYAYNVSC